LTAVLIAACGRHIVEQASPPAVADAGPSSPCEGPESPAAPAIQLVDSWRSDAFSDRLDVAYDASGRASSVELFFPTRGYGGSGFKLGSLAFDDSTATASLAASGDSNTCSTWTSVTRSYSFSLGPILASSAEDLAQKSRWGCDANCLNCPSSSTTHGAYQAAWLRDAAGRLSSIVYHSGAGASPKRVDFGYDAQGNASCRRAQPAGGDIWLWTFGYDDRGRRAAEHVEQRDAAGTLLLSVAVDYSYSGNRGTLHRAFTRANGFSSPETAGFSFHMAPAAPFPAVDLGGSFPERGVLGDLTDPDCLPAHQPLPFF
jgi:hypothetical protein